MTNTMKNRSPLGKMKVLHDPRKMQKGSPSMGPKRTSPSKSSMQKSSIGSRTGDVVSDESENDAQGDNDAPEDEEDSDDDADVLALPGALGPRGNGQRLAGLVQRADEQDAIAGAIDDDNYDGVDDVSDSDDDSDDKAVRMAAEKELIAEFEGRPQTASSMSNQMTGMLLIEDDEAVLARRLSLQSQASDDYLDDLDFSVDPYGGLPPTNSLYDEMWKEAESGLDLTSWRNTDVQVTRENSMQSAGHEKKVRFAETVSSRSSSMSSEDDDPRSDFPDLFDDGDDSIFRSQLLQDTAMAIDDEDDEDDDDDENPAIYHSPPVVYGTLLAHQASTVDDIDAGWNSDFDGSSDSDDYDSEDEGDETDEESPEDQLARVRALHQAQAAKRGAAAPASTPASAPTTPVSSKKSSVARASNVARTGASRNGSKPMSGTFEHDPSQARVEADVNGKGVRLICPTKPSEDQAAFWKQARETIGSRDGSPGGAMTFTRATPRTQSAPQRPLTAKSTLGSMFDGNLDFLKYNDNSGIATNLLRQRSARTLVAPTPTHFGLSDVADADTSHSRDLDMEDYVHGLDDSDSDADDGPPSALIMSPVSDSFDADLLESSPMHQPVNSSGSLNHLAQPGLVSSFRNNQHHARHISSLPCDPAKRARISEANALQKGRRNAANTPMTPARKSRASQDLSRTGSGVFKASASPLIQKRRRSRGNSLSQTLSVDHFADARKQ